jgi:hypothetical protein
VISFCQVSLGVVEIFFDRQVIVFQGTFWVEKLSFLLEENADQVTFVVQETFFSD